MKKFTIALLSVIFVALIAGSVQSISADDLEPRQDFSEDEKTINFSSIGHDGLQCIPIFQVLIPTMTLEPTDVITQHWTVLRELGV